MYTLYQLVSRIPLPTSLTLGHGGLSSQVQQNLETNSKGER